MRYGRQTPTFEDVGDYESSRGAEAVELFEGYGVRFIPAQRYEMELYLAKNWAGECAAITIALSRPRQNGKSYAARFYALWCAFVEGKSVLYSAHNGSTTRKFFKLMVDFIEGHEDFARKLKPNGQGVYRAKGAEGIYLADGTVIEFSTRTNSGARGGTYEIIVVDEAQQLTADEYEAIKPTTIATDSGDPQMIYLGTPPGPKCPGTVFREMHDKAHDGTGTAWWLEWAADEVGDPADRERWYETNPMMGYRIREHVMADAAGTMAADSFAREYLGWWPVTVSADVEHVMDADTWGACETDNPPEDGLMTVGVKFSPDGSRGSLSVCMRPMDEGFHALRGPAYVELVETRSLGRGVGWFADWIAARKDKISAIAIDGRSGSGVLIQKLIDAKVKKLAIVTPSVIDVATANAMILDAARERIVTHYGQEQLTDAMTRCAKRKVGQDGFGFEDTDEGDATVAESCALAYWQAMTTKRRAGRKCRVG